MSDSGELTTTASVWSPRGTIHGMVLNHRQPISRQSAWQSSMFVNCLWSLGICRLTWDHSKIGCQTQKDSMLEQQVRDANACEDGSQEPSRQYQW